VTHLPGPGSEASGPGGEDASRRNATRDLRQDLLRYLPSQVIPALIAFVTIPIITRLLSPAEYGDYRLVLAAVAAFGAAGGWLAAAVYRFFPAMELSGELAQLRATLQWALGFTLGVFAIVWLGGVWLLGPVSGPNRAELFLIGGLLMLVNTVWGVVNAEVRTVREVNWYSTSVVLNKALTLGLGVGLVIWGGLRVDGLLLGSIIASLILLPLLLRVVRRRLPRPSTFSRSLAAQMWRYGLPIILVQLLDWALQLSDRFILSAMRNQTEVGLYSAAYGIAEQGMGTIVLMFELPFSILGARVWERGGSDAAAGFVSDSTRSYLLVAVPAWAGLSTLAGPIMAVMTSAPFHEAAVIMPVVSLALLFGAIQWWYTAGSIFSKKTGQTLISMAAAVVVNVGLNLVFIERYGYPAAAVTSLVGYIVALVVMIWLSRRDFRWAFPFRSLGRALVAAGVMSAAIWALRTTVEMGPMVTLLVSVPVGIVIYGLALLALGEPQARSLIDRFMHRS
jgi:O-antigen/teichoic acid export membrane protein